MRIPILFRHPGTLALLALAPALLPPAAASPFVGEDFPDCNDNGVADDLDISSGTSQDCNQDGIPDECPVCPPLDLVFVMDTSGSMGDESQALCATIGQVAQDLANQGITLNTTVLGITQGSSSSFPCLTDSVSNLLGPQVPGDPPPGEENLNDSEDWAPGTAIVADRFPWIPGAVRIIVPISDEGAEDGDPCDDPGEDRDSLENAIAIALVNGVVVSPIAGTGSDSCVIDLMADLAAATGGTSFVSTDPQADIPGSIAAIVLAACQAAGDCDQNGVPDECQPDSDGDGIPDACEEASGDLDCSEFDRYEELTPADTLTLITSAHNPELAQGYLWVVAVDDAGQPVAFDHLIGQAIQINGIEAFSYSTQALDFRAAAVEGSATDLDADGILDLNGAEYERAPGRLLVPRFFGQGAGGVQSELILIGLSGGRAFTTVTDLWIVNDNEVVFSAEHSFRCWDKVPLLTISQAFSNSFLADFSGDDPQEGISGVESGWLRVEGALANSSVATIVDPAVYAVLVERRGGVAVADLPFELCDRAGHLLPAGLEGDQEEAAGEPGESCDAPLARRRPASLLLFPEFDNRVGGLTALSVTNVNAAAGTRLHFVYIGRFGL